MDYAKTYPTPMCTSSFLFLSKCSCGVPRLQRKESMPLPLPTHTVVAASIRRNIGTQTQTIDRPPCRLAMSDDIGTGMHARSDVLLRVLKENAEIASPDRWTPTFCRQQNLHESATGQYVSLPFWGSTGRDPCDYLILSRYSGSKATVRCFGGRVAYE